MFGRGRSHPCRPSSYQHLPKWGSASSQKYFPLSGGTSSLCNQLTDTSSIHNRDNEASATMSTQPTSPKDPIYSLLGKRITFIDNDRRERDRLLSEEPALSNPDYSAPLERDNERSARERQIVIGQRKTLRDDIHAVSHWRQITIRDAYHQLITERLESATNHQLEPADQRASALGRQVFYTCPWHREDPTASNLPVWSGMDGQAMCSTNIVPLRMSCRELGYLFGQNDSVNLHHEMRNGKNSLPLSAVFYIFMQQQFFYWSNKLPKCGTKRR